MAIPWIGANFTAEREEHNWVAGEARNKTKLAIVSTPCSLIPDIHESHWAGHSSVHNILPFPLR